MAHYDKDYSALRAEVIESLYPADQLLALYMVQRAQDGDNVAAHRIVNAYAPVWRGVARGRYEESFCKADRGIILGDIEGYAYDTCVSALMGHRLQTVEAIKAKEGPVSVEDLTTLLNPQKLKKQWELNVEVGPRITNTAVFIYLLKRTLDDDLEITEPLYTPGGRGTSLPWDSPAKLDRLVDDCAWVLFHGMLPELATAEDPWINANRFDPVRARWNLAGFFKMVVESKLSDIYEKEYVRRVDGKRVFNVTFSLDREQEGHEGQTYSLNDKVADQSNMEEQVESVLDGEAMKKVLNKARARMPTGDRALLDRMLEWLKPNDRVNLSQMARELGKDRKTLKSFFLRARILLAKEGVEELL